MLVLGGIRTQVVLMTSPALYQLSYPDNRLHERMLERVTAKITSFLVFLCRNIIKFVCLARFAARKPALRPSTTDQLSMHNGTFFN